MKKTYVLYNKYAGNNTGREKAERLKELFDPGASEFVSLCDISDYSEFFKSINADDDIVLCGGDGTLNVFVNNTEGIDYPNDVYCYGTGTGNDFIRDVGEEKGGKPFLVNEYLKDLPVVTVNGKKYRFLNNVGYGIDGYCCEVGDEMRESNKTDINYTSIAIKGLLFHYRPTGATVIVDGVEHRYEKVWLAPTMNGRFYGGGMMPTPAQDRLNSDGTVSVLVFYGTGKLGTLMAFPSLFKGEHVKKKRITAIHSGSKITVRFDAPRSVQIDGETIKGVSEYTAEGRRGGAEISQSKIASYV